MGSSSHRIQRASGLCLASGNKFEKCQPKTSADPAAYFPDLANNFLRCLKPQPPVSISWSAPTPSKTRPSKGSELFLYRHWTLSLCRELKLRSFALPRASLRSRFYGTATASWLLHESSFLPVEMIESSLLARPDGDAPGARSSLPLFQAGPPNVLSPASM